MRVSLGVAALGLVALMAGPGGPITAQCGPNPIVCENQLTGNPSSEWDVSGSGDATIQGFATDMSVNKGGTLSFKVTSPASFTIKIYRLGYYQGNGARRVDTIGPFTGTNQAACLTQAATGLYDCGNWTVSASWNVPGTAVSGIYIARLIRSDTLGASHIPFVVRDDAAQADILLQTSDPTWQAYNQYGGKSLYLGSPTRAYKVSYNRPFATRSQSSGYGKSNYVFYAEYPMVRWLESNGFNVKYWSGVDTDRLGATALTGALKPKAFLSIGHDEYWSGGQRTNVEAARAAGVNLAFMSGNDVFWKTRYENSIDGANTPYRTLVTYKETHENQPFDPSDPPTWTGTWRDPRFSPPGDAGRPENALTGTLFTVNRGSAPISVPSTFSNLRFWRNTSIASLLPGNSATLALDTIGYEWNEDLDNGSRPPGSIKMSLTNVSVPERVMDFGSTYLPASSTHSLVMYRHTSGALVFGAGTVQWVWGLDATHDIDSDFGSATPDPDMRQATVNLFADMGVQPATIQGSLLLATASSDSTRPTSTVTSPANGANLPTSSVVTISGTASDVGGVVGGVEVSTDGGATWRRAQGTANWSYSWAPAVLGPTTILSRAADDSGNLEQPSISIAVTVTQGVCPCSVWAPSLATPWMLDSNDAAAVEVGLKFQVDVGGVVNGVRFYKAATNTGTHTGHLWTSGGTLLASVTFSGESASGWQTANFASQVIIQPNTTYVISYFAPNGHYSDDQYYFGKAGVDRWPLHALKNGVDGSNGVFNYSASGFPAQTWFSDNYWVDVLFTPDLTSPTVTMTAPADGASISGNAVTVSATASDNLGIAGVQFKIDGVNLNAEDTISPYSVSWNSTLTANGSHTLTAVARDTAGNLTTSAGVTVNVFNLDTVPPTASITSPLNGGTVGGIATVTASASDNQGVIGVQFLVDGASYGAEDLSPPYTITWDTSALANNSTHTVAARARDGSNNQTTSAANTVTISNPVPGAPAIDTVVWDDQPNAVTTNTSPVFSTSQSNELLLAFISGDYLGGTNTSVTGISGAGLTWVLVGRTNVQAGTAEVWRAFAPSPLTNVSVTATLSQAADSSMTIVTFSNVDMSGTNGSGAIGATASGNALSGAPTATLTTTQNNSWVFGVGTDYDTPTPRTVGANQVLVHQYLPPVGDTYWVQRMLNPTPTSGTSVTINDTAPASDRYNLFIVEIKPLNAPDTTPPTVSMTAPSNGATVSGSSVTVSATASDNVSVSGVQFKLDGANLGAEDTASPYSVSWNSTPVANGSHTLTAVARDSSNNTTTATAMTVTVNNDTTPPTVAITAPSGGATVANTITVSANAADETAVSGVQFKLDGANLGAEVATPPYSLSWNTTTASNGSHTLTAVARDSSNNTTTSALVTVTVNNVDGTAPTASMTAPANGATVIGASVTVSATASDNVAVIGVQFLLDGVNLGLEDTASPYSISWNSLGTPNGSHTLAAIARDGAGNTATATAVTVTVNNDTTPPTVSVTAPAGGSTVSGAVTVSATASDNVGVFGVQFLLDGAALGAEDTVAPYSVSWDTTTATNGSHTLAARARDAAGNLTTSTGVSVTVSNLAVAPVIDAIKTVGRSTRGTTIASGNFSTTAGNELLLAFVMASANDTGTNMVVNSVTGGSLTWTFVRRTNVARGTAEIWRAFAPSTLTNVAVTANLSQNHAAAITVVSFKNVDTTGAGAGAIGATNGTSSPLGAPSASLVTTRNNSLVFGTGNDWDGAIARTLGPNQTSVSQFLGTNGDTFWVQRMTSPVAASGTTVTIDDTAPANHQYNLTIVEVLGATQ